MSDIIARGLANKALLQGQDIMSQFKLIPSSPNWKLATLSDLTTARATMIYNKYRYLVAGVTSGTPGYGGYVFLDASYNHIAFEYVGNKLSNDANSAWFILGGDTNGVVAIRLNSGALYKFTSVGGLTPVASSPNLSATIPKQGDTILVEQTSTAIIFRKILYGTTIIIDWFTITKSTYPSVTEWSVPRFGFALVAGYDVNNFGSLLAKNIRVINQSMTDVDLVNMVIGTIDTSDLKTSRWNGKRAVFFGDSLTAYNSYLPITAGMLGVAVNNYATGGRKVLDIYNFINGYDMASDANLVVIFIGINDFFGLTALGTYGDTANTTYYGTLKMTMDLLQTKFPSATIAFITFNRGSTDATRQTYVDAIIKEASDYAFPVLDLFRTSGINVSNILNFTNSDLTHYNALGGLKIGYQIAMSLNSLG